MDDSRFRRLARLRLASSSRHWTPARLRWAAAPGVDLAGVAAASQPAFLAACAAHARVYDFEREKHVKQQQAIRNEAGGHTPRARPRAHRLSTAPGPGVGRLAWGALLLTSRAHSRATRSRARASRRASSVAVGGVWARTAHSSAWP